MNLLENVMGRENHGAWVTTYSLFQLIARFQQVSLDEMIGWHHQLNEHEFGQTLGDSEVQGSLACCSPWGCKELDTTKWLNNNI